MRRLLRQQPGPRLGAGNERRNEWGMGQAGASTGFLQPQFPAMLLSDKEFTRTGKSFYEAIRSKYFPQTNQTLELNKKACINQINHR